MLPMSSFQRRPRGRPGRAALARRRLCRLELCELTLPVLAQAVQPDARRDVRARPGRRPLRRREDVAPPAGDRLARRRARLVDVADERGQEQARRHVARDHARRRDVYRARADGRALPVREAELLHPQPRRGDKVPRDDRHDGRRQPDHGASRAFYPSSAAPRCSVDLLRPCHSSPTRAGSHSRKAAGAAVAATSSRAWDAIPPFPDASVC